MPRRIIYRKHLLRAVEAFLEGTPSALLKAQRIIRRYNKIHNKTKALTIDWIAWGFFFSQLTDSVFYEDKQFLRDIHDMLLGLSSRNLASQVFYEDFRSFFTADEAEWYAQLISMLGFVTMIPFAKLHEIISPVWQATKNWDTMRATLAEAVQVEQIGEEYQHRMALIEALAAKSPSPENIGDEKI